jgi:hypothetical protein
MIFVDRYRSTCTRIFADLRDCKPGVDFCLSDHVTVFPRFLQRDNV